MPCDSRITIRTSLKNIDIARMSRALAAANISHAQRTGTDNYIVATHNGGSITIYADGRITATTANMNAGQQLVRQITQAYSAQVIRDAGNRFGFAAKTMQTKDGTIILSLTK